MKKLLFVLCCFACIFSLLCFSGCDSSTEETTVTNSADENISDSTQNAGKDESAEKTDVIITLTSDLAEVSPGEEFIVTCTVKESRLFAAGDLIFSFDKELITAEFVEEHVKSMYSFSNEVDEGYQYSAYVASTIDIENAVLFNVYCVVGENCKSGDEIEITLSCDEWLLGADENGDDVKSIADNVTTNSLLIKVK